MDAESLLLTLRLAALTTLILLGVAVPLAWWLAQGSGFSSGSKGSRASGIARALIQAFVALPLVLPPTVIGFYLLVGLGPLTATGRAVTALLGHTLAFSFPGLLLGSIVYSLPFAVQPLVAGFQAIDPGFYESAAGLGMTPFAIFREVILPLARTSLLTAAVLTFTHTVGEFGVVLMVGGNIPGVTRTLSIALYDRVEDGDYSAAAHISLLLVVFSALALGGIYLRSGLRMQSLPSQVSDAA